MKDIGEGTIRRIDWTELTPVVLLLRVFNVSLGLRVLAIAMIGFWLTVLLAFFILPTPPPAWNKEEFVNNTNKLPNPRDLEELPWDCQLPMIIETRLWSLFRIEPGRESLYRVQSHWDIDLFRGSSLCAGILEPVMVVAVWQSYNSVLEPYFRISVREQPLLLLWLPGVVLIWACCGGMICRIVALRLTVDESESTSNLFLFLRKRGIGFISSLIILSLGILCCALVVIFAHWLGAVPGGKYVITPLLPIPILFAFFAIILTFGLAVGWMLLFAAVSTDGSDGFDAISRMFSYIFQRPLHYLFYWFCSGILGWLGLLFVWFVSVLVARSCEGIHIANGMAEYWVWSLSNFWIGLVYSLPTAYAFAWFWTSSVAIYLLLRRSVDATPFNEVYRVAPPKIRTLPIIKQDERGAPEVSEPSHSE